ncbi:zf-DNL-domain-containing protein [Periconia macrospinosa]|uniref:Zf-DNL-domain-containing protein n=1 Tax=Periconia macrospinosa TaxID=97972 RepID=A0A2V1DLH5_9PLEO|nr:zf-DNL-domain-containing protein [Periconia macrospinosa]
MRSSTFLPSSLGRLASSPATTIPRIRRIPQPKRFCHHLPRTSTPTRPSLILSSPRCQTRSSTTTTTAPDSRLERDQVPAYELTFTCKVCTTRSSHRVSKQGYHHGTVLISCPGCKNRHLISDHMKIFSDKNITIEDIMREKGDLVKRGTLAAEGDVEFWDDGTTTGRSAHFHPNTSTKSDPDAPEGTLTEPPASKKAP